MARQAQARTVQIRDPAPGTDSVKILSGVFEGKTTGTPIGLLIEMSMPLQGLRRHRGEIPARPCDYTYWENTHPRLSRVWPPIGARNRHARCRGRDCHAKVLVQRSARKRKSAARSFKWSHAIDRKNWDWAEVSRNPFFSPDAKAVAKWADYWTRSASKGLRRARSLKSLRWHSRSLGAPVYGKLDADIASALMSINASKGAEIRRGLWAAALPGEENADEMRAGKKKGAVKFLQSSRRHPRRHFDGTTDRRAVAFKPTEFHPSPRRPSIFMAAIPKSSQKRPA